ncbi:MAG: hypothetical protein GEU28_01865 [Dehalococcoidia bacterium]|nr:hypothetical protein [Dehalococcoidia bacterium]
MSILHDRDDQVMAGLEDTLAETFAVEPDPFRQVAIRAQVLAEVREMNKKQSIAGALEHVFSVEPRAEKYAHYRQMAVDAAREPVAEAASRPPLLSRALAFITAREGSFERSLNASIEAVVGGRASVNDCLQQFPRDADRMAPLLMLAQQLRYEYSSLPLEQRVSGVRWRVLRATREPQTAPLAAETAGSGGFMRHLQWAAPLTSGVAAAFVLSFLLFQSYAGDSDGPSGPGPQVGDVPPSDEASSFRVDEVTARNEVLARVRGSVERVQFAVIENRAPSRQELEDLAAGAQDLNEQLSTNAIQSADEFAVAYTLSRQAAQAIEAAGPLVAAEDQALVENTRVAIEASQEQLGVVTVTPSDDEVVQDPDPEIDPTGTPEPTASVTPGPTDEPTDEPTATPTPDEGAATPAAARMELLESHNALVEDLAQAPPEAVTIALLNQYAVSLNNLIALLESDDGASDGDFVRGVLLSTATESTQLTRVGSVSEPVAQAIEELSLLVDELDALARAALQELHNDDDDT